MHGYTYVEAQGTKTDVAKARAAFNKSCKIDPEFEACETAKSAMQDLGN